MPDQPSNKVERRRLLNKAEAADFLGVDERWVNRAVFDKRIPYLRLGNMIRFEPEALDEYLEQSRVKVVPRPDGRFSPRRRDKPSTKPTR